MASGAALALFMLFLATLVFFFRGYQRKKVAVGLNIPPGSSGLLPLIGETLQFARFHPATTLGEFMEHRMNRYGKIYQTHLLGNPTVVSMDLKLNKFILHNDGRLFEHDFPKFYMKILGKTLPDIQSSEMHRSLKSIFLEFLGIPRLRTHFLAKFELFSLQVLDSWKENAEKDIHILARDDLRKVAFYIIVEGMLGLNPGEIKLKKLHSLYHAFVKGFHSLPIDLPGTTYRKALQARATILQMLEELIEERTKRNEKKELNSFVNFDYLDMLLESSKFSTEHIRDHILGMLFAGHETSSTALAFAIYFLGDCPKAIQQLRHEHLEIVRKKNEKGESGLNWEDYKQMEFTHQVVRETMRLGNVANILFRKAVTGIKFEGYDIPKGWSVLAVFAATHLHENVFEEPHTFNPWRWQESLINKEMMDNYMPFGQGLHKCAGNELTKMEIAVFLHHLVLKYDWKLSEPDQPMRRVGFVHFPKGLPIKLQHASNISLST